MAAIKTSSAVQSETRTNGSKPPARQEAAAFIAFGPYRLFPDLRRLERTGHVVELGSRAFDILCALTEQAGEIVANRDLMARVWGKTLVGEGSLRVQINALRKTLARDGMGIEYIKNVGRRGYSFIAPVRKPFVDQSGRADTSPVELGRLPLRPGKIVGRADEIQQIVALLGESRFVTIIGSGGLGKSTVAVEVAYLLLEHFDLVRFVDLEPIKEASWVASAIASALGLVVIAADTVPSLRAYLREKRVLLIFDSCERVLESVAMLAEQILDGSSRSAILATSQEALRARGERTYNLGPLRVPPEEAQLTLEEALCYSAIELFVARARDTVTQFQLTASDAAVTGAICRRIDGIPLAIELAAGRVGTLALPTILALLDSQFALTWPGRRTAAERHRTLGAAIAWTVELLNERERALLRRLAVFSSPFTLEAAQHVTSDSLLHTGAAAEALSNLVAKSLVSASSLERSTPFRSLEQRTHFWLLGVTHAFAGQMLEESGELNWVAQRHATYFCEFLERTYAGSTEFVHAEAWRSHAAYLTNVRAALEWALKHPDGTELLSRLSAAAGAFLLDLSLPSECVRWASIGLAALNGRRGSCQELELQASLGLSLMFSGGSLEEVRAALDRGLELADEQRDHYNQMRLLGALTNFHQRTGDLQRALRLAERAKLVAQSLDDPACRAMADWLLGACSHLVGDHASARRVGERAWFSPPLTSLVKRVRFGFDDHRVRALCGWARSLWLLGRADEARSAVPRVLQDAERFGHPIALAGALLWLTPIWSWTGDWDEYDEYSRRLLAHAEQHSLEMYRLHGRGLQGQLAVERGEAAVGIDALREATELLPGVYGVQYSPHLALALAQLGSLDEALATIDGALEANEEHGGSYISSELLRFRGNLLAEYSSDRWVEAETLLRQSFERAREQGALGWQLRAAMSLVRCNRSSKSARALLEETYSQFSQGFQTQDLVLARQLLGETSG